MQNQDLTPNLKDLTPNQGPQIRENTFNEIFPTISDKNDEGGIITEKQRWGRLFTYKEVDIYRGKNTLATAEAILTLAWRNREVFKNCLA
jgi:hypothetical protein